MTNSCRGNFEKVSEKFGSLRGSSFSLLSSVLVGGSEHRGGGDGPRSWWPLVHHSAHRECTLGASVWWFWPTRYLVGVWVNTSSPVPPI